MANVNVLNTIATTYVIAMALLNGYCSADNTYRYGNAYEDDVSGMTVTRLQHANTTTDATTLEPLPTNTTTTTPLPTNTTTTTPLPTNTTTTTPLPTNATTPRPVPDNGTAFSGSVPKGQVRAYSVELPVSGLTININATQGAITGYYSFSNSQPNATVNDGQLSSNGPTTIRRPTALTIVKQAVSHVYIGISGTDDDNQFVVTASPAGSPGGSAVSLYINITATVFGLVLCTLTSQFIS